ncbi:MAG: hypothetical protein JWQ55_2648 [Rhodopila sp.]|jgi:hypothetical protein|nr:hypothetical protein [Rhodopila sp.]
MISTPRIFVVGAHLGILARLGILICVGTLAIAMPADAQPPSDSNVSFDAGGLMPKKPKPGLPDVKSQPLAWPRLDPGAVLCRTEADLQKLGARRRGESVDGPIDCQIIRAATAISILQRKGPGLAEVQTSNSAADAMTGWTDAWLPDKGRVGPTSVSR